MLRKVVGHWSLSMFASKSQLSIAELIENGLQQVKKLVWHHVEHLPCKIAYLESETDWEWKNQVSSFLSHHWLPLKIKKRKIDQMNANMCCYLVTLMTAIGAFFSGPAWYKMYRKASCTCTNMMGLIKAKDQIIEGTWTRWLDNSKILCIICHSPCRFSCECILGKSPKSGVQEACYHTIIRGTR